MLKFNKKFSPQYGEVTEVSPLIRRLVAHNPSPFTFYGTGTYIVGKGGGANCESGGAHVAQRAIDHPSNMKKRANHKEENAPNRSPVRAETRATARPSQCEESLSAAPATEAKPKKPTVAIIDPGPVISSHLHALEKFLEHVTVSHILVTHNHVDHSPAAAPLKQITGAEVYAFDTGQQTDMDNHAEEGRDRHFKPDHILKDGDVIKGDGWTLAAVHTPGHLSNHLCFALQEEKALFTGDHVMGWSTSVVSQPDGDMKDYIASLEKLLTRDDRIYYPTHGGPVNEPKPFVRALIAHRHNREQQILAAIADGAVTIPAMVAVIYADIPTYLHPAAASSVLSHLIHMAHDGRITCQGNMGKEGVFGVA